ncbi:MAG: glutathione peroxidase [Cytophagaceae bacterium]|nr:glutathione peroxidase [Cytophagaceae bacterium]MDW8455991.1 glutathione peroxidase [Cytophagaceae bacterium]
MKKTYFTEMFRRLAKFSYSFIMLLMSCGNKGQVLSRPENVGNGAVNTSASAFYDFKIRSLEGNIIDFSVYKGKKVLIVNTASECGFTPQYQELQKLHEQYGDKVAVLGFPCNDFGAQEPGSNQDIQQFCKKNYGVTFQMFEKISIKQPNTHPLYQWLSDKSRNGWNSELPGWNFCKYLISENGELLEYYGSAVSPMGKKIIEAINK